jgi:hypothetical protein
MDLRPVNFPIKILKNDSLNTVLEFKVNDVPLDLSGATVRMQIRPSATSSTLSLALTEGSGISVGGTDNNIVTLNKLINIAAGNYVYDLEIDFGSNVVKTYLKGDFVVTEDVSK